MSDNATVLWGVAGALVFGALLMLFIAAFAHGAREHERAMAELGHPPECPACPADRGMCR